MLPNERVQKCLCRETVLCEHKRVFTFMVCCMKVVEAHLCVSVGFLDAFSTHCFKFFPLVRAREQNISFSHCVLEFDWLPRVLWEPLDSTFLPSTSSVPASGFFFCSLFSLFTLHVLVKEVQRNQC